MHIHIQAPKLSHCPKCGKPVLAHTVCKNCGYYKGREVINVMAKLTKKEKKQKQREIEAKEKTTKPASQQGGPLSMQELSKK